MKVHRDITAYEAKPMFGLTWRRLAALAVMTFGGGGVFVAVTAAVLYSRGASWSSDQLGPATTIAMYAMFPFIIPPALWAWLRPMGLRPEIYFRYAIRHSLTTKVITYADTYEHRTPAARAEPVSGPGESPQQPGRADRRARKELARRQKEVLSEHAPQQGSGRAGSTRRTTRKARKDRR
jgi:hypothetical protein